MSFYRTLLATVAAMVLAVPAFATDATSTDSSMTTSTTTTMSTESKVNVNKATAKELMKVKGLNAAKARAIIAYRKKHGDFKTLNDLTNVKGFNKVKPDTMKEIQDQLTVE